MLGSFSEQRLSFRGAKSPVLTGEAFAKWVLRFEARRPISRKSGSIWYRVWCRRSGLAAGAKLVAVAPRRTPPARSNGTLYHISGLTVEPPQRRQQKNTPARGMFFCWCRWSGLAAGAKLVAMAPRRTPPARSNGTLYHISGLTVEPPQRRQQKNTPARGMFFCWCRWSDSNRHGIATTGF